MNAYRIEGQLNNALKSASGLPGGVQQQFERIGLNDQVEQRPWLMLGAAVAVGYVLGSLLGGDERKESASGGSYGDGNSYVTPRTARYDVRPIPTPTYYTYPTSTASDTAKSNDYANGSSDYANGSSDYSAPGTSARPVSYSGPAGDNAQPPASSTPPASSAPSANSEGLLSSLLGDTDTIKSQATDVIRGILRDTIRDNVPQVRDQVDDLDRRKPRS